MQCPHCCSAQTTERSDRTTHGYRRFRCRGCGRGFNERTSSVLNRLQLPTDVVFLIVLWRLRMKLSLRDLAEILLLRGLVFSHEAVRDWEARLAPLLTEGLRQRRAGKAGRCWPIRFSRSAMPPDSSARLSLRAATTCGSAMNHIPMKIKGYGPHTDGA